MKRFSHKEIAKELQKEFGIEPYKVERYKNTIYFKKGEEEAGHIEVVRRGSISSTEIHIFLHSNPDFTDVSNIVEGRSMEMYALELYKKQRKRRGIKNRVFVTLNLNQKTVLI